MDWDDLRYLEAIHRTGSVQKAARDLRISASTVYRRLHVLEGSLGYPCVVRGLEPAVLTDAGRALALVGEQTRRALAEAAGTVRAKETAIRGEVSLTTVEGLLPFLVAPIAELARLHPALQVSLHLADTGPSVRQREVDVAIGIMPRPPSGCWGRRVLRLPYGVFGTKEAAHRKKLRWVVRGQGLLHSPEAAWERARATDVAVTSNLLSGVVALVAAGVGVGLLPRLVAQRTPGLVELEAFREQAAPLERVAWVLTHPDQRKTPRVAALVAALTAALAPLGK
ncbi:MAG: LysR family transcriptional regulator [Myxococcales bacterium]|nr:LysR family transcriptional regulator [Myxococcales bacterium]